MDFDRFENLIVHGSFEAAAQEFFTLLIALENGQFQIMPEDEKTLLKGYTRVASAVSYLVSNERFLLTPDALIGLLSLHRAFQSLFAASVYETADDLVTKIARPVEGNQRVVSGEQMVTKLLAVYSLDSSIQLDFASLLPNYPNEALPAYLSLLSTISVFSVKEDTSRNALLELGPDVSRLTLSRSLLPLLSNAWMLCSYATIDHKHDIKKYFNQLIRKLLAAEKVSPPTLPAEIAKFDRPTILVVMELFNFNHAMYRVYGPAIAQLRKHFTVIGLAKGKSVDEPARHLFDRFVDVEGMELRQVVGQVIKVKPDVIYYPSLGMNDFSIALANLRLAPIQLYTVGHPATTHSDCIDYVVNEAKWAGDEDTHSEVTVIAPSASFAFAPPDISEEVVPMVRENPQTIRIALAARVYKLTAPVLAMLQRIVERSSRPIEIHFFPNEVGVHHVATKRKLQNIVPSAIVHRRTTYGEYINLLNQCDIQVGTFPFGGTNSNVDTFKLGIPLVTRVGNECHSRTDAGMMRDLKLPEWLIATTEVEWEDAILRLVGDDALRVELSRYLLTLNLDEIFFVNKDNPNTGFADTVKWIYDKHEAIQASGRRFWAVEDQATI